MTNMRDIKDMVSSLGVLFKKISKYFVALLIFIYTCIDYKVYGSWGSIDIIIESIIVSISAQNSPGQCLWLQQKAYDKFVKQIVHVSFLTDKNMNPKSGKVCNSRYF